MSTTALHAHRLGSGFADALHAGGPAPDRTAEMRLYGQFIGDWTMDAIIHADDGTKHTGHGEIHFGWVLEGRAIQDVWSLPGVFYGTTLRIYDPGLDAWHIVWSDPLRQFYARQTGRAQGDEIVQDGADAAGTPLRWRFTAITPASFHWIGEHSLDACETWHVQAEFFARRIVPRRSTTNA